MLKRGNDLQKPKSTTVPRKQTYAACQNLINDSGDTQSCNNEVVKHSI